MISFSDYNRLQDILTDAMLHESLDPDNLNWMIRIWSSNGDTSIDNIYNYYITAKNKKQGDLYNYIISIGWTREQCLSFIRFMHEDCNSFNDITDDKEIDNALNDIFKVIAFSKKAVNEASGTGLKSTLKTWASKISNLWNKMWGGDEKTKTSWYDGDDDETEDGVGEISTEITDDDITKITNAEEENFVMFTGSLSSFLESNSSIRELNDYGFQKTSAFMQKLGSKKTAAALGLKSIDSSFISQLICRITTGEGEEKKSKQFMLCVMLWSFGNDGTPSEQDNSMNVISIEMTRLAGSKIKSVISDKMSNNFVSKSSKQCVLFDNRIQTMYNKLMNGKGTTKDVKTIKMAVTDVTPSIFETTFKSIFKGAKRDKSNEAKIYIVQI